MVGKLKTCAQMTSILLILLGLAIPSAPGLSLTRDLMTWLAVLLTVYSGLGYLMLAVPNPKKPPAPTSP